MIQTHQSVNEPVKTYEPGSKERQDLQLKYDEMANQSIEIPLLINGEEIKTGDIGTCIMPHDHKNVIARYHKAGEIEVKNAIQIRGRTNFKSTAGDVLITSQLRSAIIFNKKIKSSNYTLETINKKIYIFGIAFDEDEKKEVIKESKAIYNVKEVIPTIYLVSELSRNKN